MRSAENVTAGPDYTLQTIGQVSFSTAGVLMSLPTRGYALVALLALSRRKTLTRAEACANLWGGASAESAKHSLSQLLVTLRRRCPDLVHATNELVLLNAAVRTDLDKIRRELRCGEIRRALMMYGGAFLEDLPPLSREFDDWRCAIQRKLAHSFISAIESWLPLQLLKGHTLESRRVIRLAERRLKPLWDRSMLPQWQQDALSNGPPSETCQIAGRDRELNLLHTALTELQRGRGSFVVIAGEAGMGKTTLVEAVSWVARSSGTPCIVLRGYETRRTEGLQLVWDLISSDALRTTEATTDDSRPEVVSNLHEWRNLPNTHQERRHFLFERAHRLILSSRHNAVVIIIDDLHWLDESSLDVVKLLAKVTSDLPLLVIVTLRPSTIGASLITEAMQGRHVSPMSLASISRSELKDFVRSRCKGTNTVRIAKALWDRTAGHPYLVGEVIRSLSSKRIWTAQAVKAASSPSVATLIAQQVAGLSAQARLLLNFTAACGKPTHYNVVRLACALPTPKFLLAVDELMTRGLLQDTEGKISCAHDLIRQSVYTAISVSQRRILHRRIASVLSRYADQSSDLLYHYHLAGNRTRVYVAALREARRYNRMGAGVEADYYYSLAIRAARSDTKKATVATS